MMLVGFNVYCDVMIKLSKTGWNNVIIFAVMGFILLINATHENVYSPNNSGDKNIDEQVALIGPQQVILTLNISNSVVIERIGRTWRALPVRISGQALEQMMMSWQQTSGQLMAQAPEVDQQFALKVKLDIAGLDEPMQLSVFATDQQLLVFNPLSEQWLVLPIALYSQLFPPEIFTN